MVATELLAAFAGAGKRTHLVGNLHAGVIIALDMEGRLFAIKDGKILNRVNPEAVAGQSTHKQYLNPGGDGLWPAPEGTSLGYQYSTGIWRTSPGLRSVRYMIVEKHTHMTSIQGEVDLINNKGYGIPTIFKRKISIISAKNSVRVHVRESIIYIGSAPLKSKDCLLAPWSLCQFDSGPGCAVVFPCANKSSVWDLYEESSLKQRNWNKGLCSTYTDGKMRYQIAIDKRVPWIEFQDQRRGLFVRRSSGSPPNGQSYIDIRDASPDTLPGKKGVRYSVYSDPAKFMEIEAVGGCPKSILPGTEMSVDISTRYHLK